MKAVTALTATALLALGTASTLAQPTDPGGRDASPFRRLDRADREALFDAQMAAIPIALRLTAEQRALWTPVEQSLRAFMADRLNRQEERRRREEASLGGQGEPRPAEPPAASAPAQPAPGPAPSATNPAQPAPHGSTSGPASPPASQAPQQQAQGGPQTQPPPGQDAARAQPTERWLEEIEERSQRLAQSAERVRAFSAAMRPFWASLDDRQRRMLTILMRWPRGMGPTETGVMPGRDDGLYRPREGRGGPEAFGRDRRGFDEEDFADRYDRYEGRRDRFPGAGRGDRSERGYGRDFEDRFRDDGLDLYDEGPDRF